MNRLVVLAPFVVVSLLSVGLVGIGESDGRSTTASRASAIGLAEDPDLQFVGQFGGSAWAVDVQGDLAYAAIGQNLVVIDVTDERAARTLGTVLLHTHTPVTPTQASAVWVAGAYAYVAGDRDVQIISVAAPTRPEVVATLPFPAVDLAVAGTHILAVDSQGLHVIDATLPADPRAIAFLPLTPAPRAISFSEGYAYIVAGSVLHVIDARRLEAPGLVRTVDLAADACAAGGGYLYCVGKGLLHVLDVADPGDPRTISDLRLFDATDAPEMVTNVVLAEGRVYASFAKTMTSLDGEIYLVDVTNATTPSRLGSTRIIGGYVWDIAGEGNRIFCAAGVGGVRAVDFDDPDHPVQTIAFLSGLGQNVAVTGSYGIAVRAYGGLTTIDVTDPGRPLLAGQFPPHPDHTFGLSFPTSIALHDTMALVADTVLWRVELMDVTDPSDLRLIGAVDDIWPLGIAVEGDYAYITAQGDEQNDYVAVVDVGQPSTPRIVGRVDLAKWSTGIAVAGDYAYVVSGSGLNILDVHSPTAPRPVGFLDLLPHLDEPPAGNVLVAGQLAFVVTLEQRQIPGRFAVVDIHDPASPVMLARIDLQEAFGGYGVVGLALSTHYVCIATYWSGLQVVDVARPDLPRVVATFNGPGASRSVRGVDTMGDYVLLAAGSDGVLIFRLGPSPLPTLTPPAMSSPSPSPSASPVPTELLRCRLFLPYARGCLAASPDSR